MHQYTIAMHLTKRTEYSLALLRMAVGWHFLYEGLVKVTNPAWSSKAYLLDSGGWFSDFFFWIAHNAALLKFVDQFNAVGLSLIGLFLVLGIFSRIVAVGGAFLLALYYLSHPPFPGIEYFFPSDGSYFIVNKILVELMALAVIYHLPAENRIGLRRFVLLKKKDDAE